MEETTTYKGFTIKLEQDEIYDSPREWDNLARMICWHRRYVLGDEQPECSPTEFLEGLLIDAVGDEDDARALMDLVGEAHGRAYMDGLMSELEDRGYEFLPLYLYDHSGITISTGPFSCPWDSGQVGFIYVTKDVMEKTYGSKPKTWREDARRVMRQEVATYDAYLTGDVVGYVTTDEDGEHVDSCWGFYPEGDGADRFDYVIEQAKGEIDAYKKARTAERKRKANAVARMKAQEVAL